MPFCSAINARLMWERDQWRREKDRARDATAAVAASMGLRMTSPHTPKLPKGGGASASAGASAEGGGDGPSAGFAPLERFPLVALMPFCPSSSDGAGARDDSSAR